MYKRQLQKLASLGKTIDLDSQLLDRSVISEKNLFEVFAAETPQQKKLVASIFRLIPNEKVVILPGVPTVETAQKTRIASTPEQITRLSENIDQDIYSSKEILSETRQGKQRDQEVIDARKEISKKAALNLSRYIATADRINPLGIMNSIDKVERPQWLNTPTKEMLRDALSRIAESGRKITLPASKVSGDMTLTRKRLIAAFGFNNPSDYKLIESAVRVVADAPVEDHIHVETKEQPQVTTAEINPNLALLLTATSDSINSEVDLNKNIVTEIMKYSPSNIQMDNDSDENQQIISQILGI